MSKDDKLGCVFLLVPVLISVGATMGIAYVVIHFVVKYW